MDGRARKPVKAATTRRWAVDLAMLAAIGLLMGFLGPFDSERAPVVERYVYWMICIVGGGLIGVWADALLGRRITKPWKRVAMVSVLMTGRDANGRRPAAARGRGGVPAAVVGETP